jgi:hypothetical protein
MRREEAAGCSGELKADRRPMRGRRGHGRSRMDPVPRGDPREQTSAMRLELEKPTQELWVDHSVVARI